MLGLGSHAALTCIHARAQVLGLLPSTQPHRHRMSCDRCTAATSSHLQAGALQGCAHRAPQVFTSAEGAGHILGHSCVEQGGCREMH